MSKVNENVVKVTQGKLRGAVHTNVLDGSSYVAFKGIPFAAPPVGNLRFKDPQPLAPWSDIKDVSKDVEYFCTQMDQYSPGKLIGDEDCLYLNVYTNSCDQSKPIMFWIYGGSFIAGTGSSNYTSPDYLLAKDVVVVTTNYRVGAFGFLNLKHPAAPGNLGLKDLIAALEWVQKNIANFGGDPNNVTVFGGSAGAILTHALAVSPCAKGLFHKAICQSGLLLCPFAVKQSRPERGFKLASLLGMDSTDPEEVVEFLRTVPAAKIVEATNSILQPEENIIFDLPFAINSDAVADRPVLPLPIEQSLSNDANIPVIIGYMTHEMLTFVKDKSEKAMSMYNHHLPLFVKNLVLLEDSEDKKMEELMRAVKNRYFDGQPITADKINNVLEFFTDVYVRLPMQIYVENRLNRKSSPTYLYKYSYVGNEMTSADFLSKRLINRASHGDELSYLFYSPIFKAENPEPPAVGTKDRITIERLTRMWTNFAKTGNPTPSHDEFIKTTWKPATKDERNCLEIGDDVKLLMEAPHNLSDRL